MIRQRRLRWLGNARRIKNGRNPEDILYAELTAGKCNLERSQLRYRDLCKRDMKELSIDKKWEELATYRSKWKSYLQATLKVGEKSIITALENKRRLKKN